MTTVFDVGSVRPAILALGTAVPPHRVEQAFLCSWLTESLDATPALTRWLRHLYKASGIETRYSCLSDAERPPAESRFAPGNAPAETPTTSERMAIYERAAPPLGAEAAQQALAQYAATTGQLLPDVAASVTHLIAVSCTGFFAPGLDLAIVQRLGLRPTVQRTLVGFMGCAAAFNALRLAQQIVQTQPDARVLIVCVELCSIHTQAGQNRVDLTVTSLFADGAAACLVGAIGPDDHDVFVLDALYTHLTPDTEEEMAWRIGDHGFVMQLSSQIPRMLGQVAPQALEALFENATDPRFWAIHPGGRSIVDQIEQVFNLTPEQVAPSRAVLRRYGNMSSPTILFVLKNLQERLREQQLLEGQEGVAMAFGPGLVTEMARLTYYPTRVTVENPVEQPEEDTVDALA